MAKVSEIENKLNIIPEAGAGKWFIVGGFVRNRVMSRECTDIDVVCENPLASRIFADKINGNYFTLGERLHRVKKNEYTWDFTELKDSIEEDLSKRDFSCNALAVRGEHGINFSEEDIIDPYNGLEDIRRKILSSVSNNILTDDYVRIVRAFRFKSELDFQFSEKVKELIERDKELISEEKGERIAAELEVIFNNINVDVINEMKETGIFDLIYDDVRALENIKKIYERFSVFKGKYKSDFTLHLSFIWNSEGIAERLRLSNYQKDILREFLKKDFEPFSAWLKWGSFSKEIFTARYIISGDQRYLKKLHEKINVIESKKPEPLINGREVMKYLNIKESPKVGRVLKEVLKAQYDGAVRTKEDAVKLISEHK